LYRAYLVQSHIFVGIYWQRYGWVAPDMTISGLEDEFRLVGDLPKLIYIKGPAPEREPRLTSMIDEIKNAGLSYKPFTTAAELGRLVEDDLSLLLSERFERSVLEAQQATASPTSATPSRFEYLPVPTSTLVGRERELEEIANLLLRGEVRLVTLVGPGGIGKTRLSIGVAHRVKENFEGGMCFVPLANARDVDGVVAAIASALRMNESTADTRPLRTKVIDLLRDKHALLVLDNFEQAMVAVPFISELLMAAPQLEILVSSREVLHLQGEHGYEVRPLDLPPQSIGDNAQLLRASTAVQLFVERARAAKTDFALTDANAQAVAAIVRRLDGLPLAIELAAARVRMLTPQALLTRLENSLQTLTAGARDLPERQQTLRNTLDWSYSLLAPNEQRLFARFAVFETGGNFEAIQEVLCAQPIADAFDGLSSLVDKSLIQQMRNADASEPRFGMLQTIREYAHEKLAELGEVPLMRDRHADYFHKLIWRAQAEMHSPSESAWFDKLVEDADNLQAAERMLIQSGKHDIAAHIAWTLWHFWLTTANLAEWQQWTDTLLAALPTDSSARAKALTLRGGVAVWMGDHERGIALIHQGAEMFAALGKTEHQSEAMMMLGLALLNKGDATAAAQAMEQGLGLRLT
jgi:predicted ATPase